MDSLSPIHSFSHNLISFSNTYDFLLQEKREALSSLDILDMEEENFSRNNSDLSYDSSISKDDNSDLIIVSSRSNTQFTQRLDDQIKKLSEISTYQLPLSN